jgi:hypothetical protein
MAGGRPKADQTTKRESVVAVRLSVAERAALDARAASAGLPLPDFMRAALVQAEPPRRRKASSGRGLFTAAEVRELNAVGVNLNQLAKRLNADDRRDMAPQLGEVLDALAALFARGLA